MSLVLITAHSAVCYPKHYCLTRRVVSHHGQVDIGGVQLQVDLPVDGSLAFLMKVLSYLGSHSSVNNTVKKLLLHTNKIREFVHS